MFLAAQCSGIYPPSHPLFPGFITLIIIINHYPWSLLLWRHFSLPIHLSKMVVKLWQKQYLFLHHADFPLEHKLGWLKQWSHEPTPYLVFINIINFFQFGTKNHSSYLQKINYNRIEQVMNEIVIKTKSQNDKSVKRHQNSLSKPCLTNIFLTDSTQAFISGPSLYPIFKPFQWIFILKLSKTKSHIFHASEDRLLLSKYTEVVFICFNVTWLLS